MLYLLKALLHSGAMTAVVWFFGVILAVYLICLCVTLYVALFNPDDQVRKSAKGIFKMLLSVLTWGRGR